MTSDQYILDANGEPVPEPDTRKFMAWFSTADRTVELTVIGDVRISTVFLGLNAANRDTDPPLLWETMVFGDGDDLEGAQDRCSGSREQAEAMHFAMVERVNEVLAARNQ